MISKAALADEAKRIADVARESKLDFFETHFEVVDFDTMQQIAAYGGFPQRYPHWRFGMEYERLRKQHVYGLGKIYEMVINNDPCYAYLVADNAMIDQKLVMAHVYGHGDFFKNNHWFGKTNRKMMDEMANHATRVRRLVDRVGFEPVECFIDVCLSLENLIDPHAPFMKRVRDKRTLSTDQTTKQGVEEQVVRFASKSYMKDWINPPEFIKKQRETLEAEMKKGKSALPERPLRDVLQFILDHAPLEDWQADILSMVREEAYYYAPQGQTKIMNEGWATFWHSRIMTRHILTDADVITYADHHSGTVAMAPGQINPYKIGVELFRDIEDRWNKGRFGKEYEECTSLDEARQWDKKLGLGLDKVFEVRKIHNDVTFIDEFLTPEFVERLRMYHYRFDPTTRRMVVVNRDFEKIKAQFLFMLTNHAQPYIYVLDGNYANRGELYLGHQHNGVDLDIKFAVETLKSLQTLWHRPVHLQAQINDEMFLFSFDGNQSQQQRLHEDMPDPVHAL
ncbi:MAG: SpoVR family protein [Planctomycetota bacterium]|nr:SpoVR family protein [Planctomycetota bacterium]